MHLIKDFIKHEDGVTAIEYALLAALIAVVIAISVTSVSAALNIKLGEVGAAF